MLKDQIPTGILKVDYDIPLLGEVGSGSVFEVVSCLSDKLNSISKEMSLVVCLDSCYRPMCIGFLGYGTENNVDMSVKETVQFALLTNASGVILLHNHPGNGRRMSALTPSKDDIAIASRISEALKLFEISLVDSVIINCDWILDCEHVAKAFKVDDEKQYNQYKRVPAFYSMRGEKRYKSIFNIDPDKKINLTKPEFSGEDRINTKENEEFQTDLNYALNR